ncbi:uncharacterized protein NFIA_114200 [Aspergillus fischeri NRRL 181]|uniref:Uncharacterized protein n=1 Tax=Neosartorya fischeri (strain ATCC 1020 / DSM 3700 / CBS 544.65 / FGSC A1164 / JCM 1740 / NRRL 181 / WB 181) TaxID=331117 RepID=A1D928_NEOFI|nr:uncharacterized protein NFIA_114200 [Aspergillus fischeri NRRL 181]EAW20889.1 hypothetical protein NFIA_114200 [Aspergillus fischeri NRRL 181]
MVSDNLLSSLSAYATIVAVLVGLATLAKSANGLTTVRRDLWTEAFERWTLYLHVDGERLPDVAYERPAIPMQSRNPSVCPYPRSPFTSISESSVILAFVFMAVLQERPQQTDYRAGTRTFTISGVVLEVRIIKPDIVTLHLEGTIQRRFTKDYVQRFLGGYLSLPVDPQNVSVFKAGDEVRGGSRRAEPCIELRPGGRIFAGVLWLREVSQRRRRVSWRTMDRVRLILESVWAKTFKDDADRNRIIAHFNEPPRIEDDEEQQRRFRAERQPLLRCVLIAPVKGSIKCIAYFKNPGRALEHILPTEVLKSARLYQGC